MPKRRNAWYERKWVPPLLGFFTLVSAPFLQDIRKSAIGLSDPWDDRLFGFLFVGGLIGLVIVLVSKSERAARSCEDLREQLQKDLEKHRHQSTKDLSKHSDQMQEGLAALLDSRLEPIREEVGTLQSRVSALDSRMGALESRITALQSLVSQLSKES